jgi:hypothetical protein
MTHYSHPLVPLAALATVIAAIALAQPTPQDPPSQHYPTWMASGTHASSMRSSGVTPEMPALNADAADDELIEQYCAGCHSDRRLRGNLSLETFTAEAAADQGAVTEKMIRKLRAGMMPPPGARRPEGDSLVALRASLERRMDAAAKDNPNPGMRTFQRLNRAEYQAAVRDLLGIEVDVGAFLPLDTKSANFDNIADVQMPSATQMEGYLRAAGAISRSALGDPNASASSTPYRVPRNASQKEHVQGAPIGTRGGLAVPHDFPADGRYVFQVTLHAAPEGELFGRSQLNEQVEVSIDGERVALLDIDRWMSDSDPTGMTLTTDSIFVRAGQRKLAAAFIKRFDGPLDDLIRPLDNTLADTQIGLGYGVTTLPHLQVFTVVGPHDVSGVSETPTRAATFTCRPTSAEEARPCAESIVSRLATQAYRRTLDDGDVEDLMAFYDMGAEDDGFEGGVRIALQAILASPHFVFRTEEVSSGGDNGLYDISDVDLASRLSFFLWGTVPDAELIELASKGDLSKPSTLEAQVRRMLASPRAEALSTRFAGQWLRLPDLERVHPDALDYPYFDYTLAESMKRETELFFDHLVRDDRSALDMLTADYTFVNERLARHYGIPNITGSDFQRVSYPDETRRGLLGHGSILTQTSHANRTSPVLRGKWVMEVLMGSPPPPPPPDVPDLEEAGAVEEGRILTIREQMEKHRANPTCNSCHRFMDPIGLALENFDVTGAWRVKDHGNPVDPTGELYDGSPLSGPADLRAALLTRPEVFLTTFTENLMAYALGRRVEYFDMPTVRAITRDAAENGYRMSTFVLGVVNSPAFQSSRAEVAVDADPAGGN